MSNLNLTRELQTSSPVPKISASLSSPEARWDMPSLYGVLTSLYGPVFTPILWI